MEQAVVECTGSDLRVFARVKTPLAEAPLFKTSTSAMPFPVVRAPVPPALLTKMPVGAEPRRVESTTSMSDCELGPPALRTVLSCSVPPLATKTPPPSVPGV